MSSERAEAGGEKPAAKKKVQERAHPTLAVSAPPHIRAPERTDRIMLWVIVALLPVTFYSFYVFGALAVRVVIMAIAGTVGTEAALQRIMKRKLTISDGSAVLTGLLLALTLPPAVPWWIPFAGGIAAIGVAKYVFGGLGFNIFNPALVGRTFLLLSWAKIMTGGFVDKISVDTISGATPLYIAKQVRDGVASFDFSPMVRQYLISNAHGSVGECSALLLLVGAAVLLYKRIIDWRTPAAYIGVVIAWSLVTGQDPVFQALSGGIMLGAFFMATDYVTSPMTPLGKLIFGAGCGFVNMLLRFYSGLSEAAAFSILFMNSVAPMIDKFTIPKPWGWVKQTD